MIEGPSHPAPEEQAGEEISEDRPEGVLVAAIIAGALAHAAMVDEL